MPLSTATHPATAAAAAASSYGHTSAFSVTCQPELGSDIGVQRLVPAVGWVGNIGEGLVSINTEGEGRLARFAG